MKKTLLLLLAIGFSGLLISQQTYQFRIDTKTESVIENPNIGLEPIKTPALINSHVNDNIIPTADRDIDIVTIIPLGTVANAYGWGYAGGQESLIPLNQDLNTIAVIHRMGGEDDPGGYSGDMAYDVSFDGGMTWTTQIEFYIATENDGGEYFKDAGRYPNAGIYDPTGNYTDPAEAYLTYFAPILWGSNDIWGGYATGVTNFGDTSIHTKDLHTDLDYYIAVPSAYFLTSQGLSISVDYDYDLTGETYNDQIIVSKGYWDDDVQDMVYTFEEFDAPMDVTGYPYDEKVAFSPDGMTGYITALGNDGNAEQVGGRSNVYPIYWKTTDGGENWDGPNFIQLDGANGIGGIVYHHLTDELIEEMFEPPIPPREDISYTTAFDHDIAVTADGNLHIAVIIGLTSETAQSIISNGGFTAAVDLFTNDGGTTWYVEEMGRPATFRGDFGDLTEDNRIRITTDWLGSKVFISWLDTDIEDAEDNNAPNIFCRGFDPASYMKTINPDGEDAPVNVTKFSPGMWQSYFGNAAKFCFTNDNGYNIPFVYENMNPADPAEALRLMYIQDFYFTDADFTIQGVEDNFDKKHITNVSQNFPNPFTNETFVTLSLGNGSSVSMDIYSITGQKVLSKDYGFMSQGSHTIRIQTPELTQGVYFYSVSIGETKVTKKMIVD